MSVLLYSLLLRYYFKVFFFFLGNGLEGINIFYSFSIWNILGFLILVEGIDVEL